MNSFVLKYFFFTYGLRFEGGIGRSEIQQGTGASLKI